MVTAMNKWMKRRIERSRARCERTSSRPQIDTDTADKKTSSGTPFGKTLEKKNLLDGHTASR